MSQNIYNMITNQIIEKLERGVVPWKKPFKNGIAVNWKTQKPLTVGSQIEFKAQFLGKQLAYTYEIKEFVPGQKLVMRTAEGPFPMETTYTWTSVGEGVTRMTLRNAGKPTGFSKLMAPFLSSAMKRANKKDLQNIKKIIEAK
jgi:hypothetical protein